MHLTGDVVETANSDPEDSDTILGESSIRDLHLTVNDIGYDRVVSILLKCPNLEKLTYPSESISTKAWTAISNMLNIETLDVSNAWRIESRSDRKISSIKRLCILTSQLASVPALKKLCPNAEILEIGP